MNFREGFRRLYVLFSVIALLFGAGSIFKDLPSEENVHWLYLSQAKEEVAEQLGINSYGVSLGTLSNGEFLNKYCRGDLVYSKGEIETKLIANKGTCNSINQQINDLPHDIAKHIGLGLLYLILGALGLLLVYLVGRWIFNGFFPQKTG